MVGSDTELDEILLASLQFGSVFRGRVGCGSLKTPPWVRNKKCTVNIESKDNRCFERAVKSAPRSSVVAGPGSADGAVCPAPAGCAL